MVKHFLNATFITVVFFPSSLLAQFATFENFGIPLNDYLNGSDLSGGYMDSAIFFPNSYDTLFDFWSEGFAISTMQDDSTAGYMNMYSSIVGSGHHSDAYAVVNAPGTVSLKRGPVTEVDDLHWLGLWITNSTYAYLSMLNGDGFAKKFGGTTGDDQDYFFVRVYATDSSGVHQDSLDFYLADYRDTDNSNDYILDEWVYLDLSGLKPGNLALSFRLFSSDIAGGFINTPLFFCIDDVEYGTINGVVTMTPRRGKGIFPNPATDILNVSLESPSKLTLMDLSGRIVFEGLGIPGLNRIGIDGLTPGLYLLYSQDQVLSIDATKVVIK